MTVLLSSPGTSPKFGGWIEGDVARFPSVYLKDEFEKAWAGK